MDYQSSEPINIAATDIDFEDVERFFGAADCRWKLRPAISRLLSTQDLRMPVQSGGVQPAEGVLYRPVMLGGAGLDYLFTSNMPDGWDSLLVSLSAKTGKRCVAVRYAEGEIREFKIIRGGAIVRLIQAIRDGDHWQFYSTGDPLEFEERDFYASRLKKNRLPLELLIRYFKRCSGFTLLDQNAFRSDGQILHLVEQRH